jgi:5'-nucleotidase
MILVTNDDGILAPGIRALVEVAAILDPEVLVVAPNSPQSGQGHAITINDPIRLTPSNVFGDIESYECSGTPVDCVKLAKSVLCKNKKIDLCISGINHGSNASINIIYSGTMSAAMEAYLEGVPSIGFSLCDYSPNADFSASKVIAKHIIEKFIQHTDVPVLLNVNIPKLPYEDIKGIKVCRQGKGSWVEDYKEGLDPRGGKYYWLAGSFVDGESGNIDNDIVALSHGYVSVVPSTFDLTDYQSLPHLQYLENL